MVCERCVCVRRCVAVRWSVRMFVLAAWGGACLSGLKFEYQLAALRWRVYYSHCSYGAKDPPCTRPLSQLVPVVTGLTEWRPLTQSRRDRGGRSCQAPISGTYATSPCWCWVRENVYGEWVESGSLTCFCVYVGSCLMTPPTHSSSCWSTSCGVQLPCAWNTSLKTQNSEWELAGTSCMIFIDSFIHDQNP